MNPWYDEAAYIRKLREQGYTEDEIDATLSNLASDWYDRQKDYEVEDNLKGESK